MQISARGRFNRVDVGVRVNVNDGQVGIPFWHGVQSTNGHGVVAPER